MTVTPARPAPTTYRPTPGRFRAVVYGAYPIRPGQYLWNVDVWDTEAHALIVADHTRSWDVVYDLARKHVTALELAALRGDYTTPGQATESRPDSSCPCPAQHTT